MKNKYYSNFLVIVFLTLIACSSTAEPDEEIIPPVEEGARQIDFPSSNYVMVGAHRGGFKGIAPENSLKAIKNSLALGVDIIEIDVRVTKDNKLVIMHDKTLDRTTNGSGETWRYTQSEIKTMFLKDESGTLTTEHVPTLAEVMTLVGNKAIVMIDKSEFLVEEVVKVLTSTNSTGQALFIDFIDFKSAKTRYGSLLDTSYYVPGVHDSTSDLDAYYTDFKTGLNPAPSAFAFWFKSETSKALSFIDDSVANAIPVWVNTTTVNQCAGHTDLLSLTNPDAGWGWVLNKGANIIFTDQPTELLDYLTKKSLR